MQRSNIIPVLIFQMFTLAAWLRMGWNTVSETTEKVIFAVFKQRIQVTGTKMGGMMEEGKTRCRDCTYKKMLMFPLNPHGYSGNEVSLLHFEDRNIETAGTNVVWVNSDRATPGPKGPSHFPASTLPGSPPTFL